MSNLIQDFRFGLRMLAKNPAFSAIAMLVLALTIGGNTAMFSIVNVLALRPLTATAPDELVGLFLKDRRPDGGWHSFSYPNYLQVQRKDTVFTSILAHQLTMIGLTEGESTRRVFAAMVSANYFSTFDARLACGRAFLPEEEKPASAIPVVIVSHAFWKKTGCDPALVGQTVRLNSRNFTVVGVAPEYFTGTAAAFSPEFWVPLGVYELLANDFTNERKRRLDDSKNGCLYLVGRLKPGVTLAAAQSPMDHLARQLEASFPVDNKDKTILVAPLQRLSISSNPHSGAPSRTLSILLLSMSGVVLLIACLNLANMLMARGAARRKEFAIRVALGGGRLRIVRQLLTEGFLLSIAGGAAGLLLAQWSMKALIASLAPRLPFMTIVFPSAPDSRVLLANLGFCCASTLLFGLGPALKLSGADIMSCLKEQTGEDRAARSGRRLWAPRHLLVIGQISLSLALLTAAGLFIRGAVKAASANPGFSLGNGILVEMDAALAGYDEARGRQAYLTVLEKMRGLPGVESASLAQVVPFGLFSDGKSIERVGRSSGSTNQAATEPESFFANWNIITADYFKTLGIPLLRGRAFDRLESETAAAPRVAMIDQPLAERLFPGEDAVGRQIQFPGDPKLGRSPEVMEIIGVVAGVKNDLSDKTPQPHLYVPFGQQYRSGMNLHLRILDRGHDAEMALLKTVREQIRAVDEKLPVLAIQTLRRFHDEGLMVWFIRAGARLFVVFGVLALLLSVVGVYGVKAYIVTRRTREIGIRMALGATTRNVLWMILREGLSMTAAGLGVGLLLAVAAGLLLRSMLYEVKAIDPLTFIAAPIFLAAATLAACYLPARRAARINPLTALRYE